MVAQKIISLKTGEKEKSKGGISPFDFFRVPFFILAVSVMVGILLMLSAYFFSTPSIAPSSLGSDLEHQILLDYQKENQTRERQFQDIHYFKVGVTYTNKDIEFQIKERVKNLRGSYSVVSINPSTNEEVLVNPDKIHTLASLSKIFLSALALTRDPDATGIDQMVYSMLHASDNEAFQNLFDYYGFLTIQGFIDQEAVGVVDFQNNEGSARSVAGYLKKLQHGDILTGQAQDRMIQYMTDTLFEERLPVLLPDDVQVAHKIGTWEGNYHDAGIVFTPFGSYIIAVMTSEADYAEAIEATQDISRLLYEYWNIKTPVHE